MVIIGENIHIISAAVSKAVKERDAKFIHELAKAQADAGAPYIDINLGPARKDPEANTEWLVTTVQEVTDLPLAIDTLNPVAMEAGLKACKKRPLLNSASARTDSKEKMLPLAPKYNTDVVISVITDTGCPPDVDARVDSIMGTVELANELGIATEDIWVDPILIPVSADQQQVVECMEFMKILGDILPGIKSTIGLSNISNGTPEELRPILNRTCMVMLEKCGLYSAIADALDKDLMTLANGGMPNIIQLIHKVMDGEDIDLASLSQQELDYVKTAKVLTGETLYSHSWLEV